MYRLTKKFSFEASHVLPQHSGKCARLHGHSWKGAINIKGPTLHSSGPQAGMLIDFYVLSNVINPIVEQFLDHQHLNDSTKLENPTSEELARWIYHKVALELLGIDIESVTIEETCTSSCEYSEL